MAKRAQGYDAIMGTALLPGLLMVRKFIDEQLEQFGNLRSLFEAPLHMNGAEVVEQAEQPAEPTKRGLSTKGKKKLGNATKERWRKARDLGYTGNRLPSDKIMTTLERKAAKKTAAAGGHA